MNNIDLFYSAVVVALGVIQIFTSYWLFKCRDLIDRQTAQLTVAMTMISEASATIIAQHQTLQAQDATIEALRGQLGRA
jgi:hypothetical protein